MTDQGSDTPSKTPSPSAATVIVMVVVALFAGILLAKALNKPPTAQVAPAGGSTTAPANTGATTITSEHNDALADYEAALKTGKPIYVLFHSLTCDPCVEISAVVDKVMPEYEGKVVFVNAISDDAPAQQLASRFQFQYIPSSFFIAPGGAIADSFTGSMTDADMRARLDKLVAE